MLQDKPCDIHDWLSELGAPSADRDYQPGHERVLHLISALAENGVVWHRPKLRIRVAGTNGKGSTAHFLAAALQANGLKVGLYTSPHIRSFHERIRVQNCMIGEEELVLLMEKVMPLAMNVQTSYFETATVLALLHFSMAAVDVEILEAGVGAKLDATTSVPADLGLLTPVALDHQLWLGESLQEIALEKSWVFAGCRQMLSVEQHPLVQEVLHQTGLSIRYAKPLSSPMAMLGKHQLCNAGLAFQAMKSINDMACNTIVPIDMKVAERAIRATRVAGRLQHLSYGKHQFWLDAAHNAQAIEQIAQTLSQCPPFDVIFLCTREDRDLSACVSMLQPFCYKVVRLTGRAKHDYPSVDCALTAEVPRLKSGRFLLLGSFMTLDSALVWMERQQV